MCCSNIECRVLVATTHHCYYYYYYCVVVTWSIEYHMMFCSYREH